MQIRPTEEELKEMGPEFNELWNRYFKDKPDKPVMFGSIVGGAYADHSLLPPGKYITMFQYLEYPASRGKIHVKSTNPYVEPFFDSGFLNNKADFAPIRWSYKKTRELARRMDCESLLAYDHNPCIEIVYRLPWRTHISSPAFPPELARGVQGH